MIGLPTQMGGWGQRSFSTPAASAMPAFSGVATATRNASGGYTQNPDTWGSALQSGGQSRGFGDAYPSMPPGMAWGGAATMFRPQQPSPAAMGGPTGAASAPSGGFPSTAPMARGRSMMPPPMTAGSSGPIRNTMGLSPFMPRGDGATHAQPAASSQPSSTPGKMLPNPYGGASGAAQPSSGNQTQYQNQSPEEAVAGWRYSGNIPSWWNQQAGMTNADALATYGYNSPINSSYLAGSTPWQQTQQFQQISAAQAANPQNNSGIRPSATPWASM